MAIPILLSVPTSGGGATPAATYSFYTSGYRPPRQGRSAGTDIVHNQNGIHKYRYDNGPNVHIWEPFQIRISDDFRTELGAATTQWQRLQFLWNYVEGPMKMHVPEGIYDVVWADAPLERRFGSHYPTGASGDKLSYDVVINFEEG